MARRRKVKVTSAVKVAVKVDGVVFGTVVHDEEATVVEQGGVALLQSKETGQPYKFPAGFAVTPEMYGEDVDITIRDITSEVILARGEDDVYEEDLEHDERLMPVESVDDLQEIFNERKIKLFMKAGRTASTFVAGCVLTAACWWLNSREFAFPLVVDIGIPAGVLLGVVFGLVPSINILRQLSCKVVMDEVGNYVNMDTGKTNLNGGMKLPISRRSEVNV